VEREVIQSAKRKPGQCVDFGFIAKAEEIRSVTDSTKEKRLFCVIDKAVVEEGRNFPSHATIGYADVVLETPEFWEKRNRESGAKSEKTAAIANLVECFQRGCRRIEEIFRGVAPS